MAQEDRPVAALEKLVGAAAEKDFLTARTAISTRDQQGRAALVGRGGQRLGNAAPAA